MIKVSYYQRKPRSTRNFSIENYFNVMRTGLHGHVQAQVHISKFESSGFFKRLYNCMEAIFRQGDVNHVTGDINFINLLNIWLIGYFNILSKNYCTQLSITLCHHSKKFSINTAKFHSPKKIKEKDLNA